MFSLPISFFIKKIYDLSSTVTYISSSGSVMSPYTRLTVWFGTVVTLNLLNIIASTDTPSAKVNRKPGHFRPPANPKGTFESNGRSRRLLGENRSGSNLEFKEKWGEPYENWVKSGIAKRIMASTWSAPKWYKILQMLPRSVWIPLQQPTV
jgi:hypothetical protein